MLSTPKSLCTSLIASLSFGLDTELSGGHLYLQVPQVPQSQWVPNVFSQKPFFSSCYQFPLRISQLTKGLSFVFTQHTCRPVQCPGMACLSTVFFSSFFKMVNVFVTFIFLVPDAIPGTKYKSGVQ